MPKFKSLLVDSSDEDESPEPKFLTQQKKFKKRKKVWDDSSDDGDDSLDGGTSQLCDQSLVENSAGFCLDSVGEGNFGLVCAGDRGSSLRSEPCWEEKEESGLNVESIDGGNKRNCITSEEEFNCEHPRIARPRMSEPSGVESQHHPLNHESFQERNESKRATPPSACWLNRQTLLRQSSRALSQNMESSAANLASRTASDDVKTADSRSHRTIDMSSSSPLASYKPSAIMRPSPRYAQAVELQSPPSNRLKTVDVTASKRGKNCGEDVVIESDSDWTDSEGASQHHRLTVPVAEWWKPPEDTSAEHEVETSPGASISGPISWSDDDDGVPLSTEDWILIGQHPDLYGWLESRHFIGSASAALAAGNPLCTGNNLADACRSAAQEGRLSVLRWLSRHLNFNSRYIFRSYYSDHASNHSVVFEAARNGHVELLHWLARTFGGGDLTMHNDSAGEYGRGGAQGRQMLLQAVREHTLMSTNEGGGFFPLLMAAWNGHLHVVRWLFVHGAEPSDVCDLGRTPLFYARTQGHFNVVRWLLLNGGASGSLRARSDQSFDGPFVDDALVRSGFYEDLDSGGADDSAVVRSLMFIQPKWLFLLRILMLAQYIPLIVHYIAATCCALSGWSSRSYLPRRSY